MKYARIERERRFLLAELPGDLPAAHNCVTDWYIAGTRFRLRRVEMHTGETVALKFTQKYHTANATRAHTTITNQYLNQEEFDRLRILGGHKIQKQRFNYPVGSHRFSVDVFQGHLEGLLLAEIEFDNDLAMAEMPVPDFAMAEVTTDLFFTGGNLAGLRPDDLKLELKRRRAT